MRGRVTAALAALALSVLGGCKNPIVQDILWGTAALDDITVSTGEGSFQLSPVFNPGGTEYKVTVPFSAREISVRGTSRREASIAYRKIDGGGNETANGSGDFPFEDDEAVCTVFVRIDRAHADGRTYRIEVNRGADAYLNGIVVYTQNSGAPWAGPQPLLPGYDPALDDGSTTFRLTVSNAAETVWIGGLPGLGTGLRFEKTTGGGSGWQSDDGAYPGNKTPVPGRTFLFPAGEESAVFRIEVVHPDLLTPLYYKVEIHRPGKVSQDPSSGVNFTIDGEDLSAPGASVPVDDGKNVTFFADPGFGYQIDSITCQWGSETKNLEFSPSGLYSFTMRKENVVLTGTVSPVQPVTGVRYVRPGGTGDGSSWANASGNLQAMIEESPAEIWIARGTITPDWTGTSWYSVSADKKNWSFVLKDGVKIYGGFTGAEEDKDSRNWKENKTILSGSFGGIAAKHVVIAAGVGSGTRLEAVTISGGLTTTPDGGPLTVNSKPIDDNSGAGLYCIDASPVLRDVTITGNKATYGAGIVCFGGSSPLFLGLTVNGNAGGNAVFNNNSACPVFIGSRIDGNEGHGIDNNGGARAVLVNSTLSNNAGAGLNAPSGAGTSILINSLVSRNRSDGISGMAASPAALYNSLAVDNTGIQADDEITLEDSYAPGHVSSLPPGSNVNRGDNSHYPGVHNSFSPLNGLISLSGEVTDYLLKDINGNSRFINGTIDLGPEEQQ